MREGEEIMSLKCDAKVRPPSLQAGPDGNSQALQNAGQEATRHRLKEHYDTVRVPAGWKKMGASMPLHKAPAARFQGTKRPSLK